MLTRHIEEEKQNKHKLVKTVESLQKAPGITNTFWKFQQHKKNVIKRAKDSNEN